MRFPCHAALPGGNMAFRSHCGGAALAVAVVLVAGVGFSLKANQSDFDELAVAVDAKADSDHVLDHIRRLQQQSDTHWSWCGSELKRDMWHVF